MKRSRFNLSHYNLLSLSMGKIYPIDVQEVLPGDSFKKVSTALIRCQPMLAPIMHPVKIRIHHWYVPNRLVWDEWEDFITGGPDNISLPKFPKIKKTWDKGSLGDYFGLPIGKEISVNALPFRAYNLIFNEFYRDEDLVNEAPIITTSGDDTSTYTELLKPSWRKDYFTTARPWTQKGLSIGVPVLSGQGSTTSGTYKYLNDFRSIGYSSSTSASATILNGVVTLNGPSGSPVTINFDISGGKLSFSKDSIVTTLTANGYSTFTYLYFISDSTQESVFLGRFDTSYSPGSDNKFLPYPASFGITFQLSDTIQFGIVYNLGSNGSFNIRDLRAASAIQRFNEHRAQFGSRYSEYLRFLGVKCSDARLQRPEFLGGGSQLLQISEVLQTGVDNQADSGVGNMTGHGIGAVRSNRFKKFFEEHGYIISVMFILPANLYSQGVSKMWSPVIKEDFFQPELSSIGEEEIYNSELYVAGNEKDSQIFGYSHRYQRYRTEYSKIHGDFRDTLDYWHLARKFDSTPVLNQDFIQANPSKRIFAEQTGDTLLAMVQHNVKALRIVPKHAKNILK